MGEIIVNKEGTVEVQQPPIIVNVSGGADNIDLSNYVPKQELEDAVNGLNNVIADLTSRLDGISTSGSSQDISQFVTADNVREMISDAVADKATHDDITNSLITELANRNFATYDDVTNEIENRELIPRHEARAMIDSALGDMNNLISQISELNDTVNELKGTVNTLQVEVQALKG